MGKAIFFAQYRTTYRKSLTFSSSSFIDVSSKQTKLYPELVRFYYPVELVVTTIRTKIRRTSGKSTNNIYVCFILESIFVGHDSISKSEDVGNLLVKKYMVDRNFWTRLTIHCCVFECIEWCLTKFQIKKLCMP